MVAPSKCSKVTSGDANVGSAKHPFFGLLVELDETNYARWSHTYLMSIRGHEKEHNLMEQEPKKKTMKYATWIKDNGIVCVWIINSIISHISDEIMYYKMGKKMWNSLWRTLIPMRKILVSSSRPIMR